ncbi:hypothetical protein ACE102_45280 (plasmid) [Bradyrhizobium sp. vgs-9]
MEHTEERPYANPEAAARKLLELAANVAAVQDGRTTSSGSTRWS